MNGLVPWQKLEQRIRPVYAKRGQGRPPYPLPVMLRIHCVQLFYNLSDPGMEDLLYEAESVRRFVGLNLTDCPLPDADNQPEVPNISRSVTNWAKDLYGIRSNCPSGDSPRMLRKSRKSAFQCGDPSIIEALPRDFYITGISVHPEPAVVSEGREEGEDPWVRVLVFLTSDELKAGFTLTLFEVQFVPPLDSPLAKSFDREDISLKVIFSDEKKRISARWEACDIGFFMVGIYLDQFADDDLLRIVDATVKACE